MYTAILPPHGPYRIQYPSMFDEHINSLRGEKDVVIEIKVARLRKPRSVFQNAYYWGVLVECIRLKFLDMGFNVNKDETHEHLKSKFLSEDKVDEKTGEVFKFVKKSSELSKVEFMAYLEEVKMWAATTLDTYIPDPNEQLEID
jgi:hypothetical protein